MFILICWWVWRWRNAFVFEGKKISNHTLQTSVDAIRRSVQDAHSKFHTGIGGQRKETENESQWKPPPAGWVKANIHGAFSHFGSGVACGGVFRDGHGNFLKGFMFKGMDEGDSLSTKLWGFLHDLKLA